MRNTASLYWFLVGALVLFALSCFYAWRDNQAQAAYADYETCVLEQYGRMPTAFYAEHGYAPDCQI